MLQAEIGRPQVHALTHVRKQQLKRIGVACTGMRTRTPLQGQTLQSKGGDMGGNRGHEPPPESKASQRWAMAARSWGVLSRYQYVLATQVCPIYVVRARVWRPMASRV